MGFTISKAIGATIDPACNGQHIVFISQGIQAVIRPELAGHHKTDAWNGHNFRIVFKVDAELLYTAGNTNFLLPELTC